jgi:hypothetical protein
MPATAFPSQVVQIIEAWWPWAKNFQPGTGGDLPPTETSKLQTIASLVAEVPRELLDVSTADYGALLMATNDIERIAATNLHRGGSHYFPFTVVVNLWSVLSKCPDEYPPTAATADLAFIADQDLRDSIRRDMGAADRAFANAEWKAATVLAGSAIEALLLWAITTGPKADVPAAAGAIVSAGMKTPHSDPNRWDLSQ